MSGQLSLMRPARRASSACSILFMVVGALGTSSVIAQQSSGLNPNQESMSLAIRNPASLLTSLCPQLDRDSDSLDATETALLARCGRVVRASDSSEQATALQEITAEELTAASTNAVDFNRSQRSNVAARLSTLRAVRGAGSIAYLDGNNDFAYYTTGGASGDGISDGKLGLFINGNLGNGDKNETSFEAAYDFDVQGLTAGIDYRFTDSLVGGIAIGYSTSETDFDTGGSLDNDNVGGSLFGSWYGANAYADAIVSFGSVSLDSVRQVDYEITSTSDPGETDSVHHVASGDSDGDTTAAGLSAGYNFGKNGWQFGPTAAVSYLEVNVDGFSESGGSNPELNLEYADQEAKSLQIQLGFDVSYAASMSWGVVSPYARASYVWEQENDQETFFIRYVADPFSVAPDGGSTNASVTSDEPDDSFVLWAAGLSAAFANGFAAFVEYESVASLDTVSYGEATIGLRYQFR